MNYLNPQIRCFFFALFCSLASGLTAQSQDFFFAVSPSNGVVNAQPGETFCYTWSFAWRNNAVDLPDAGMTLTIPSYFNVVSSDVILSAPASNSGNNPVITTAGGVTTVQIDMDVPLDGGGVGINAGGSGTIVLCLAFPNDCSIVPPGTCMNITGDYTAPGQTTVSLVAPQGCIDFLGPAEINLWTTNDYARSDCTDPYYVCFDAYVANTNGYTSGQLSGSPFALPIDQGGISYTNGIVSATFPAGTTLSGPFPSSTANYTISGNTITWSNQVINPNTTSQNPRNSPNRYCVTVSNSGYESGESIPYTTSISGENCIETESSNNTNLEPIEFCGYGCYGDPTPACPGEIRKMGLIISSNIGALDSLCVTQRFPFAQYGTVQAYTVSNAVSSVPFTVEYSSNNGSTWTNWPGSPFSVNGVASFSPSAVGDVGDPTFWIRYKFGAIPASALPFCIGAEVLSNPSYSSVSLDNDYNLSALLSHYTFDAAGAAIGPSDSLSRYCSIRFKRCHPAPCMTKLLDGDKGDNVGLVYSEGDLVNITLQIQNLNPDYPMTDLMINDLLPSGLSFYAGSNVTASGASVPSLNVIPNYNGTGRDLVRLEWSASNPANISTGTLTINFTVRIDELVSAFGQNCATISIPSVADQGIILYPYTSCSTYLDDCGPFGPTTDFYESGDPVFQGSADFQYADTWDIDGDGTVNEQLYSDCACYGVTAQGASADAEKFVKGVLDTEFSRCGYTTAGGDFEYKLCWLNTGGKDLNDLVIIDTLPYISDTAVLNDGSPRGSEFQPCITGPISVPGGVVTYSANSNPCLPELDGYAPAGCVAANWSSYASFADPCDIRAFKVDFGTKRWDPGEDVCFIVDMVAPAGSPVGDIAWNSFGWNAADNISGSDPDTLGASEPPKVAIKIADCGFSNLVAVTTCIDNGSIDPSDDLYSIDVSVDEFNLNPPSSTYDIIVSQAYGNVIAFTGSGLSYGAVTTLGPFNTLAIGDVVLYVTDSVNGTKVQTLFVPAPAPCSGCSINDTGIELVCNTGADFFDPSDDSVELYINPTVIGYTGTTFSISGDLTLSGVSYNNAGPLQVFSLPTDAGDYTITITDDTNPGCPKTVTFTVESNCLDCAVEIVSITPLECVSGRFNAEVVLNYSTGGDPSWNYQFFLNNQNFGSLNGTGVTTNTITNLDASNPPTSIRIRLFRTSTLSCTFDIPVTIVPPLCPCSIDDTFNLNTACVCTNISSFPRGVIPLPALAYIYDQSDIIQGGTGPAMDPINPGCPEVCLFDYIVAFDFTSATNSSTLTFTVDGMFTQTVAITNLDGRVIFVVSNMVANGATIPVRLEVDGIDCSFDTAINAPLCAGICAADLALIKTVDTNICYQPCDTVTYTIVVTNQGTIVADHFTVTDYFPPGFTFVSGTPSFNWVNNMDGTATYTNINSRGQAIPLRPQDSYELTITLKIGDNVGSFTNFAEISYDSVDGKSGELPFNDWDSTPDATNDDFWIDNVLDNSGGDEDDHDPAIITVVIKEFDLALIKELASTGPFYPGDEVAFDITITNQGDYASRYSIIDYIPEGMTYSPNNNSVVWSTDGTNAFWTGNALLPVGGSSTITLLVLIDDDFAGGPITNFAEIASDSGLQFGGDVDSTPDIVNTNDAGGSAGTSSDDTFDGDGTGTPGDAVGTTDEDDHDPELITVETFDLALTKILDPNQAMPIFPGDPVTFIITVTNQGTIDADHFTITDYMPPGFTFISGTGDGTLGLGWTDNMDGTATYTNELGGVVPGPYTLIAGQSRDLTITLAAPAIDGTFTNFAEISSGGFDGSNGEVEATDVDSTPDNVNDESNVVDNVTDNTGGDEDDHDPAEVTIIPPVFDLALMKVPSVCDECAPATAVSEFNFEGKRYEVVSDLKNWADAAACAAAKGGHLVEINSAAEQSAVYSAILAAGVSPTYTTVTDGGGIAYVWIGASDVATEGTWVWDGSGSTFWMGTGSGSAVGGAYENWGSAGLSSEPDNFGIGQDAGAIALANWPVGSASEWNDVNDQNQLYYVIEYDYLAPVGASDVGCSDAVLIPGAEIVFDIIVTNQGNTPATDISVVDYIPAGLSLVSVGGWTESTPGIAENTIDGPLAPGQIAVLPIRFSIDAGAGGAITNWAEISEASDGDGDPVTDIDSTPDDTNFDGQGETDDLADDNVVDEDGKNGGDEDDHDPEVITVLVTDLALTKTLSAATPGPFAEGMTVTFDLNVTNQGQTIAYNISLVDYIPAGLTLVTSGGWTEPVVGLASNVYAGPLAVGAGDVLPISFIIDAGFSGVITNFSEIAGSEDVDGNPQTDTDSTPDATDGNDGTPSDDVTDNSNGDEDDHDPEVITVLATDLALTKTLSAATPGPFAEGMTVTFDLNVTNQGQTIAYNISLVDYIPAGLTLVTSGGWTEPVVGLASNVYAGPLAVGAGDVLPISFIIDTGFSGVITNFSEIAGSEDVDGNPQTDTDSTPDATDGNDGTPSDDVTDNTNDDEDDHDPEVITVLIPEIYDLALCKKLAAGESGAVSIGGDVTFAITVTNQGNETASSVMLTDYIPTGFVLSANDALWTDLGTTATYLLPSPLAGGAAVTTPIVLTYQGGVDASTATNFAEISSATNDDGQPFDDIDSDPDNMNTETNVLDDVVDNTGGDEDDHDPAVVNLLVMDLALTKTLASNPPFEPGDTIIFNLIVTNQGDVAAFNISLVDYIPAGLTLVTSGGWTEPVTGLASNVFAGPLMPMMSTIVPVSFTIDAGASGSITNFAEIAGSEDVDGNPQQDEDSTPDSTDDNDGTPSDDVTDNTNEDEDDHDPEVFDITPPGTFDLALTKSLSSTPPLAAGDPVSFNITVTNQGTVAAQNIMVVDYVPAGLSLIPLNGWTELVTGIASNVIAGPIAPGASETLEIFFTIDAGATGSITNFAEIASAEDPDGNPGDDVDSTPDMTDDNDGTPSDDVTDNTNDDEDDHDPEVFDITPPGTFDLALTKQLIGTGPFTPGGSVQFLVTVTNQGTVDAQNISVVDNFPGDLTLVLSNGWSEPTTGLASNTIASLASGQGTSLIIDFLINTDASGTFTNFAEIAYAEDPDGNPGDDIDSDPDSDPNNDGTSTDDVTDNTNDDEDDHDPEVFEVTPPGVFDLALTKQLVSTGPFNPGDTIEYAITVINQGTVDAQNISVVDYIPAGLTLVSGFNGWTEPTSGIASNVIAGPISTTFTLNIRFTIDASAAGPLVNFAEIAAAEDPDGNPGDDVDSNPDTDPENDGTPSDDVTDNTNGDEDDHDPETLWVGPMFTVTKTLVSPVGDVQVGDTLVFQLTVVNLTDMVLDPVQLVDAFDPAYLAYMSATTPASVIDPAGLIVWDNVGPIAGLDSFSVNASFLALQTTAGGETVNQAVGTYPPEPPVTNSVPVEINPAWTITKTVITPANGFAQIGDMITYRITVQNISDNALSNFTVTDVFDPVYLSFMSATVTPVVGAGTLTWTGISIPAMGQFDVDVTFAALADTDEPTLNLAIAERPMEPPVTNEVPVEIGRLFAVTKTLLSPVNPQVGDTLVFELAVENLTDMPLDPFTLVDLYDPAYLQYITAAATPDSLGTGSVTWDNIGPIVGLGTFSVTVDFEALQISDPETFNSVVGSTPGEPPVTNTIPVEIDAAWTLVKTLTNPSDGTAEIGDTVTYNLSVENISSNPIDGISISDLYDDAVLTFIGATIAPTTEVAPSLSWTLPTLPAGGIFSVDVSFETIAGTDPVTINTAIGERPGEPPVTNSVPLVVDPVFDLALIKQLSPDQQVPVYAGDLLVYWITVTNEGNVAAYDIGLQDTIPSGLIFDASGSTGWTIAGNIATYTVAGPLAPGAAINVPIAFTISAEATSSLANTAEITSATDEPGGDPVPDVDSTPDGDPNNDQPEEDDHDTEDVPFAIFDLALVKTLATGSSPTPGPGDTVTFTIVVLNQGTVAATNVVVTEHIPAGLTLVSSGWSVSGTTATMMLGVDVPANSAVEIDVTFTVDADASGSIQNVAEISSAEDPDGNTPDDIDSIGDDDPSNDNVVDNAMNNPDDEDDHDIETITVVDQPVMDLALIKTLTTDGPLYAGDTVTFTFSVINQGSLDAYNVGLVDYIPTGLTLADSTWAMSGTTATKTIAGPVGVGSTLTETISFTIDAGFSGSLVNGSEITGAQDENGTPVPDNDGDFDNDPSNDPDGTDGVVDGTNGDEDNEDVETIDVLPNFDLALLKSLADGQSTEVAPGDDITFNVTIFNQGDIDAYDIQVVDYIPAGLILNDSDWAPFGDGDAIITYAGPLAPNANVDIPITLTVVSGDGDTVNIAEILLGSDSPGGAPVLDTDSEPDSNSGNDNNIDGEIDNPNDEDDSDPVTFTVISVSLGDYVWQDNDLDGIQDADEPGVGGVRVVLLDVNGNYVSETVTLGDGSYSFDGLAPGTYSVQFDTSTLSGEWSSTLVNAGSDDTLDSDAGPDGLSPQTTLTNNGDRDSTLDFGIIPLGTVSGTIWEDMDNDGIISDLSMFALEGIEVTIYTVNPDGTRDVLQTVLTGPLGFYEFTGLPSGDYAIDFDRGDLPVRTPALEDSLLTPFEYVLTLPVGGNIPNNNFAVLAGVTAIDLLAFNATASEAGGVLVEWTTASETDNLGFNIYRSASPEGELVKVNQDLILAQNKLTGSSYSIYDAAAGDGTWFYFLEDIELTLKSERHGPAVVTIGDADAIASFNVVQEGIYFVMMENADVVGVFADDVQIASHATTGGLVFFIEDAGIIALNYSPSPLRMGVRTHNLEEAAEVSVIVAENGKADIETSKDGNILVDGIGAQQVVLDITDRSDPIVIDAAFIENADDSGVYFYSDRQKMIKVSEY